MTHMPLYWFYVHVELIEATEFTERSQKCWYAVRELCQESGLAAYWLHVPGPKKQLPNILLA